MRAGERAWRARDRDGRLLLLLLLLPFFFFLVETARGGQDNEKPKYVCVCVVRALPTTKILRACVRAGSQHGVSLRGGGAVCLPADDHGPRAGWRVCTT